MANPLSALRRANQMLSIKATEMGEIRITPLITVIAAAKLADFTDRKALLERAESLAAYVDLDDAEATARQMTTWLKDLFA